MRSRGLGTRRGARIGAFVLLLLVAASRAPYALLHGRFWAEEGSIHFRHMALHDGVGTLLFFSNRTAYLNLFANLATRAAADAPMPRAPLVTGWLSFGLLGVVLWVALFWPSELLTTTAARIAAATLLVVGTLAAPEVWLNSMGAQTYLGLLTVLLLFVVVAQLDRVRLALGSGLVAVAGLSGIYSCVLAPLFVWRAWRDRSRRRIVFAAVISAAALVELVVISKAKSSGDVAPTKLRVRGFGPLIRDFAGRHLAGFLVGADNATSIVQRSHGAGGLVVLSLGGLAVIVFVGFLLSHVRPRTVPLLLAAAFVLEEVMILYGANNGAGGRYTVVPIGILILMFVHATTHADRSWIRQVAVATCVVVLLFGVTAFWTYQPSNLRCHDCPSWTEQVATWQAGRTNQLAIWPYPGWHIELRHAR